MFKIKKRKFVIILGVFITICFLIILGYKNFWRCFLYNPTMISKIDNLYFIVDCDNHRVIYNDKLAEPIWTWKTLTEDIIDGHSIASDNELYVIDNTDEDKLEVFIKKEDHFIYRQMI